MDLTEAIRHLQSNAAEVLKVRELYHENGDKVFLVPALGASGGVTYTFERQRAAVPPRVVDADSIDGVVNALLAFGSAKDALGYVAEDGTVKVYLDRELRRETVGAKLSYTDAWSRVLSLDKKWYTQRDLLEVLRVEFAGKVTPSTFLDGLRRVKLDKSESVDSSVGVARQAISASILREAKLDGVDMPTEVTLGGTVFDSMIHAADNVRAVQFNVTCVLKIDLQDNKFQLVPKAGEIEYALHQSIKAISELIKSRTGVEMVWGAMG
jgi:hypothetical protein